MAQGVTVDFNANLARFTSSVDRATNDLNKFQSNAQRVSKNIGTAFAAMGAGLSVTALAASVKSVIDMADEMAKLSQRVGINVRELASWKLAADLGGASIESVAKGVKGLATYMTTYGDRLKAVGIDTTDANKAMLQLSDIFAGMPDGLNKTALATQLFGKAGLDMIPMLNQGSKKLQEIADKSKEYGDRLAELAPNAEKFNDQLTEMAFQARVVGINMATVVAGPMADWLEANNEAIRIAGGFGEALRLFAFNLEAMTTEAPAAQIRRLTDELNKYHEASAVGKFVQSPTGTLFGGREADLKKQIEFLKFLQRQQVSGDAAKLGDFRDARDRQLSDAGTLRAAEAASKLIVRTGGGKGKKDKATKYGNAIDPADVALYGLQAQVDAIYDEAEKKAKRLNDLLAATPSGQLAKAREEMQFLAAALEKGAINEEQFTEAVGVHYGKASEAVSEMGEFAREAARNMQDAMADGFFDIMQGKFDNLGSTFKATIDRMVANAVAADLGKKLFGNFGSGGDMGGWVGQLLGSFGGGYGDVAGVAAGVPQFAEGTPYVQRTGLAVIHEGEAVLTKEQNRNGFGGNITININGSNNAPDVRRAAGQGAREALAVLAGAQRYG